LASLTLLKPPKCNHSVTILMSVLYNCADEGQKRKGPRDGIRRR